MKKHPDYTAKQKSWLRARRAVANDTSYVRNYLIQYTQRETVPEFNYRKKVTPNPSITAISLAKLCKSVRAHLHGVARETESNILREAWRGDRVGVDGAGCNANSFIGDRVLKELLTTGKVGLFCFREGNPDSLAEESFFPDPYVQVIPAEDILNWRTVPGRPQEFEVLLVKNQRAVVDSEGLIETVEDYYTKYELAGNIVTITEYDSQERPLGETRIVEFNHIPFTVIEVDESPVQQALNNHDALLQLTSSDHFFLNRANFPLYTEQFDFATEMQMEQKREYSRRPEMKTVDPDEGRERSDPKEVKVGTITGRRYGKGMDRPEWIAPPTEHLMGSYSKQDRIEDRIKEIFDIDNLQIKDTRATAESKREDKETLTGAVQTLFGLFESAERRTYRSYLTYLSADVSTLKITYPVDTNLKSTKEILENAQSKIKVRDEISSITFKRVLTRQIVTELLPEASDVEINQIVDEIMQGDFHVSTKQVLQLSKDGRLTTAYVLKHLGLPESLAEGFKAERLVELAEMVKAQTNPGAGRPEVDA